MWNKFLVLLGLRTDMVKLVGKFDKLTANLQSHVAQATADAQKALDAANAYKAMQEAAEKEAKRAEMIASNFKKLLAQ